MLCNYCGFEVELVSIEKVFYVSCPIHGVEKIEFTTCGGSDSPVNYNKFIGKEENK